MNFQELVAVLHNMPSATPIFYRLYHDAMGHPLFYSMEDMPGTYIEIDRAEYEKNNMQVKIVDGKLIEINTKTMSKLTPSEFGTPCDPRDVAVITNKIPNVKWSKKFHEIN